MSGEAGGGLALPIPLGLNQRQRRRIAIKWILDAVSKKVNRSSGKASFAQRVADELIAVVEGRSSVWEKRVAVHKQGVAARANIGYKPYKRKLA
jgi:small subunit ribosomal protein S7